MTQAIQLMTTVGSRAEAERIATHLVSDRLAACVQVLGPIRSTYHWHGVLEHSEEWLCLVKSTSDRCEHLEERIRSLHSYDMPEIIVLPIIAGSKDYLDWIAREVGSREVSPERSSATEE